MAGAAGQGGRRGAGGTVRHPDADLHFTARQDD